MPPTLKYALAIPSSGGKTTLSKSLPHIFLDVDALYNLPPTPSLFRAMNYEIQRRTLAAQPIPSSIGTAFQQRVAGYEGFATVLLTHSLLGAKVSGLEVLGCLVPGEKLHEQAMRSELRETSEVSMWFARTNWRVLGEQAERGDVRRWGYESWEEMREIIERVMMGVGVRWGAVEKKGVETVNGVKSEKIESKKVERVNGTGSKKVERKNGIGKVERKDVTGDVDSLLALCTMATGCVLADGVEEDDGSWRVGHL